MDFMYEDEILDMQIAANFSKLFRELVDQLKKWGKLNLKEFNGILEIKFGREIYGNKDYYSFLTHLAQKDHYKVRDILEKPDTMLEGMLSKHGEECRKKQEQAEKIAAGLGEEKLSREMYAPDTSLENYSDMEFSLEFVQEEEIDVGEDMYVTNIIFTKC
jgi:hypothetical protein